MIENLRLVDKATGDTLTVSTRSNDFVYLDQPTRIQEDNVQAVTFTLVPERIVTINGDRFLELSGSRVTIR